MKTILESGHVRRTHNNIALNMPATTAYKVGVRKHNGAFTGLISVCNVELGQNKPLKRHRSHLAYVIRVHPKAVVLGPL